MHGLSQCPEAQSPALHRSADAKTRREPERMNSPQRTTRSPPARTPVTGRPSAPGSVVPSTPSEVSSTSEVPPGPERMNSPLEIHEVRLRGLPRARALPVHRGAVTQLKPCSCRASARDRAYRCPSGGFSRSGRGAAQRAKARHAAGPPFALSHFRTFALSHFRPRQFASTASAATTEPTAATRLAPRPR